MLTYAVIDTTGLIVNRVVLVNETDWTPPDGCTTLLERAGGYTIGGLIMGGVYSAPATPPTALPIVPATVLSQDLMAQLTVADYTAIMSAISVNPQFGLLWSQLQAQKDPMLVTNKRFMAGWNALVQVLEQPRMTAIAAALAVTIA